MLKGGDSGPAIEPGKPDESLLIAAVRQNGEGPKMPPKGDKLPDETIQALADWIKAGAPWPSTAPNPLAVQEERGRSHWAFQPVSRPTPPAVKNADWVAGPVDAFILKNLEEHGLSPSPPADKRTLLRRVTFDLTGLPPSHEEVEAFLQDESPEAFARVVDRLLGSPRYGERWGRHWLDVARYADTKGYVFQEERRYPYAYTYRDWVIAAFNADLPYDQFLIQQLAADLLPDDGDKSKLAALGFLTVGRRFLNVKEDILDDRIDVTCRGLLGLTVACARCHDHKYDPIPQEDYYSLYGVFASCEEPKDLPAIGDGPNGPRAMVLVDRSKPFDPYVFKRGNPGQHGPNVPRRFLKVLSGPERPPFEHGSGRLELARAITSPSNPLTARVLVNRVWMHHFGQPLVRTPSDFGLRSDPPSHPELLDWLAASLIEDGWSIKRLHRRILLSNAYRQQSLDRPEGLAQDPQNLLLWKQDRRRLEFEPLRDALLAVSGQLDTTTRGPSVSITEPPYARRRTVYAFIDRQNLDSLFRVFDFATPDASSPRRFVTTVPQQALFLMNHPFVAEQARHLAARPELEGLCPEAKIQRFYDSLFGRPAEPHEVELGLRFVTERTEHPARPEVSPWQYGFGVCDESARRVTSFLPFPHWTGQAWQFGPKLPHPDPDKSYLHLTATGGHAGPDASHAAIRRWNAPRTAVIAISGTLAHQEEKGDGVRGRIVASRGGLLGEWITHHESKPTTVERYEVQTGETIDFVVDCRVEQSYDSFSWTPVLRILDPPGDTTTWNARNDFQGPAPPPLLPWEQFAQVLLLTNEFAFVD